MRVRNAMTSLGLPRGYPIYFVIALLIGNCVSTSQMDTEEDLEPTGQSEFTCKNRCGQVDNMPCSCDPRCVVWRNCCEYIHEHCPQIWADGNTRFAHLLQSGAECHGTNYFMVTSCPQSTSLQPESVEDTSDRAETVSFSTRPSSATLALHSEESATQGYRDPEKDAEESSTAEARYTASTFEKRGEDQFAMKENSTDSSLLEENSEENDNGASRSILDILNAAPVTDLTTGISYLNSDVFSCNGGDLSHRVLWDVVIRFFGSVSLPILEDFSHIKTFRYAAPVSLDTNIVGPACFAEAIATCESTLLQRRLYEAQLCKNFISYVVLLNGRSNSREVYRNRYCYLCNYEERHDYIMPFTVALKTDLLRSPKPFLRITAISKENSTGESFSATVGSDPNNILTWKDVVCSVDTSLNKEGIELPMHEEEGQQPTQKAQQQQTQDQQQQGLQGQQQHESQTNCTISSCPPNFEYRSDGLCKILHDVSVAFRRDEFFFTSTEVASLPLFVECSLQHFLGFDLVENEHKMTVQFDTNTRKVLYLVDVLIYLPRKYEIFYSTQLEEQPHELIKLLAAAKALKRHLQRIRKASVGEVPDWADSTWQSGNLLSKHNIPNISSADLEVELPFIRAHANVGRGKVVDNDTTTLCLQPLLPGRSDQIMCYGDQVFEEDFQLMEKFSQYPCLRVFSGSSLIVMNWWQCLIMIWMTAEVSRV